MEQLELEGWRELELWIGDRMISRSALSSCLANMARTRSVRAGDGPRFGI